MSWKESAKVIGLASAGAISKLVLLVFVGTLFNWIFLLFYGSTLYTGLQFGDGSAAIVPAILGLALFIAGFPVLYFLVAKSYAIKSALKKIFAHNAPVLFEYFVPKVVEYAGDTYQTNETILQARNLTDGFTKNMTNMPLPLRMIYGFVIGKIPFKDKFDLVTKDLEIVESNYDAISLKLSEELSVNIQENFLDASLKNFWILLLVNIASMILIVKLVG